MKYGCTKEPSICIKYVKKSKYSLKSPEIFINKEQAKLMSFRILENRAFMIWFTTKKEVRDLSNSH